MTARGSPILAFTPTYGERLNVLATIPDLRGSSGLWFDWAVYAGASSTALQAGLDTLLAQSQQGGIQYLTLWPENRGQHYATRSAIELAKLLGYTWLLRIDDDILHKTKRWLKKLVERAEELRTLAGDSQRRIVVAPRVVGLKHPPEPEAQIQKGQSFQANLMPLLGGAVRLHPVELLDGYEPPLYAPTGRGDPGAMAEYVASKDGLLVQFPDVRVIHRTSQLEDEDTLEMAHRRRMSYYWPWLSDAAEASE